SHRGGCGPGPGGWSRVAGGTAGAGAAGGDGWTRPGRPRVLQQRSLQKKCTHVTFMSLPGAGLVAELSDWEKVGALGREAVAAGGAGQAAAQPRGGVLAGPAGVLAAGGEPLGPARPASRNEASSDEGDRGRAARGRV